MAIRRGTPESGRLCAGPGRFAQAFGIDRALNGADLVRGADLELLEGEPIDAGRIRQSSRIGVRVGVEARWRWFVGDDPFVSPGRPAGSVRRAGLGRRRG
jgi:DNA-3-methyladenine glycosylase